MSKEKILQEYIFVSKYARTINNKKESWKEAVDRVMSMHEDYLINTKGISRNTIVPYLNEIKQYYVDQKILGAQRALQWGGEQLLKHHFRLYNCSASHADRPEFFSELMFVLLNGAGIGYSVQDHHVSQLPEVKLINHSTYVYTISDSIEGWADAVKKLVNSYYNTQKNVVFDYSKIRSKGSAISGGFIAPGYKPLEKALELIRKVFKNAISRKLTALEVHEISCIVADAVISGGLRRSALIAIFSLENEEMLNCKTGDWFYKKPYLARANNSVAIFPDTLKEDYNKIFNAVKEYGEPGFVFLPDKDVVLNPCAEVGMYPITLDSDGNKVSSGFSVCNLTEINGKLIKSESDFYKAARIASLLGTIQAAYTDFKYVSFATKEIVERDALIGVGITGMAESSDILFDPIMQKNAANVVRDANKEMAKILGINYAARTTVIKPSGTASLLLNTSSGIHPFHYHRYIRNIQANNVEQAVQIMEEINPKTVETSVWGMEDKVISFPIEKDESAVMIADDLPAIKLLDLVKSTYQNWIVNGTNLDNDTQKGIPQGISHNVSNTITVKDTEWEDVKEYIWENRSFFSGVSLIPESGDLTYQQAPFIKVLDELELAEQYGAAAILAGGLNVDGIHAFSNLWTAIDTALGKGENLEFNMKEILELIDNNTKTLIGDIKQFEYKPDGVMLSDINAIISYHKNKLDKKKDWVRRFNAFAAKYFFGDTDTTGKCLKQVSIFHRWNQLQSIKNIYWEDYEWETIRKLAGEDIAAACHGGSCEI